MRRDLGRLPRTLVWLARLPLCGEPELARLLGVDEHAARRETHELAKRGWVESIEPGSPELELRRLSFVREEALPTLATALGVALADLPRALPVRLKDTLDRLARVEITAGVNRFFADLAADVRTSALAELVDARSLPLAVSAPERWWPPGVVGYGCLRAGNLYAPLLVTWDRAAAPDLQRRRRVAAWSAARTAVARRWGAEGLPPILVVCPSERELSVWEQAILRQQEDGGVGRMDVLLTTGEELTRHGAGETSWRVPGRSQMESLMERLGWGTPPPVTRVRMPVSFDALPEPPRRTASIRAWAATLAAVDTPGPIWQGVGVLALSTGATDRPLIEWIARHPLMSARELAALLNESQALVERRLEWLLRCGAVSAAATPASEGERNQSTDRYVVTELGMRTLAARAGVPPTTFARYGGVTVPEVARPNEPARIIRHAKHTIGVNRFFARLTRDARRADWRLEEWRNEAESTRRFVAADGRTSWIRPDSSGALTRGRDSCSFLLEYDRGTLDGGDYPAKFEGYRRCFAAQEWRGDFPNEPMLLFVCSDDRAEGRVVSAGRASAPGLPLLITSEWRYESDTRNPAGLLGPIWREAGTGSVSRERWPRPRGSGLRSSVCREPSDDESDGENCER